jgi:hypothetical protein
VVHVDTRLGDLIFFLNPSTLVDRLIVYGEDLHDGRHRVEPYHVAIAVSSTEQIAALGRGVAKVRTVLDDSTLVCRPSYPNMGINLETALVWLNRQVGKPYGWPGVVNQGLIDVTDGVLRLPDRCIRRANRARPYCSVLAARFCRLAGAPDVPHWPPPDPYDLYRWAEKWKVNEA